MQVHPYALENLYRDQDRDLVVDMIPHVITWVQRQSKTAQFRFLVDQSTSGFAQKSVAVDLTWDHAALADEDRDVLGRSARLASGRTPEAAHLTEFAAYGLALVAISVLMPDRKVVQFNPNEAPDFLFDITPDALRGVEVAGRAPGGLRALREIRDGRPASPNRHAIGGKKTQLIARPDIAECHLSLWCASPRVAIQEQVR